MTWFAPTPDEGTSFVAGTQPTIGPRAGFSASFGAAFADAARNWSTLGLQADFQNAETEQLRRVYQLTGERLQPTINLDVFTALAKQAQGEELTPEDRAAIQTLDGNRKRLAEIKKTHPEVLDYDEMWENVRTASQNADANAARTGANGNWLGSLLGAMAGSITTRDPFNIVSMALGGVGKSMLMRLGSEAGLNAAVEAIDQFTGVQQNRHLLGLDNSVKQAFENIAMAGITAGAVRGVGEAISAGARRVIARRRVTPLFDAAAQARRAQEIAGKSPFGDSRTAQAVHAQELDRVAREIDATIFDPSPDRASLMSSVSIPALASREADRFFETLDPADLSRVLDTAPQLVRDSASVSIRKANDAIQDLTTRIQVASVKLDTLDRAFAEQQKLVPRGGTKPAVDQLMALNKQIAALNEQVQTLTAARKSAKAPRAQLKKLMAVKEKLTGDLDAMKRAVANTNTYRKMRDSITSEVNDLRLRRAQIVANVQRITPTRMHRAIDTRAMMADALGKTLPTERPAVRSLLAQPATREFAEAAERVSKEVEKIEPAKPEIIKPEKLNAPLFHGTNAEFAPTKFKASARGPMGPGVYLSGDKSYAARYGANIHEVAVRGRLFGQAETEGAWHDEAQKLVDAAPDAQREAVAEAVGKSHRGTQAAYHLYGRIAQIFRSDAEAQALFKRAGFSGIETHVDGHEVLVFDPADVLPPGHEVEMVDLGQKAGPVDLDTEVIDPSGSVDADGRPAVTTIRKVLDDMKDDDDLIANMKACLL